MNSTISMLAIILSTLSLLIALTAIIIVLAMKWSTHKIEWKPLEFEPVKDEEEEKEDEEDGILKEALNLSAKAKNKKKPVDPLDEILETNNF